jgi:hypothetical protein
MLPSPRLPSLVVRRHTSSPAIHVALLACVAVVLVACTPQEAKSPPLAESVVFVKQAPRVGRIAVEENSVEFRLQSEATADGGAPHRIRTESVERERRREEVLAVFGRVVTKKRVTFESIERAETRNGLPIALPPNPLFGRSYLAELKKSVAVFTTDAGAPVSDVEARELARRMSTFGKPDPFLDGIPDGPVSPGAPAAGMVGGFVEMFEAIDESNRDGPDIGNVDVRFVGVREEAQGRCGVFAFALGIQMAGEPRVQLDLKGEFLVRISDGAPVRLEARGPARIVGLQQIEGINVQLRGAGEMGSTLRVTYL